MITRPREKEGAGTLSTLWNMRDNVKYIQVIGREEGGKGTKERGFEGQVM